MPALLFSAMVMKMRGYLYSMDLDKLLELDTSRQVSRVNNSRITHPDAGLSFFASRKITKREVLGYYYGSLVYANLTQERYKTKMFGHGVRKVTANTFWRPANILPEKVVRKDGVEHKVWTVPAPLCAMLYNEGVRYLPGDTLLEDGRLNKARDKNVPFLYGRLPSSSKDFSSFKFFSVKALHNIFLRQNQLEKYEYQCKFQR